MQEREISRNPEVPELTIEEINSLTHLCFRDDDRIPRETVINVLFAYSTNMSGDRLADAVKGMLSRHPVQTAMVTGGIPDYADMNASVPEYRLVLDEIDPGLYPDVRFYYEAASRNMLENVTLALKVWNFSSAPVVCFISKSHAAGRGYLTLKKFLSGDLLQRTYSAQYPGTSYPITPNNWHTFAFGRQRVWGEYLRIKTYGERGDIWYPPEIRELVNTIRA